MLSTLRPIRLLPLFAACALVGFYICGRASAVKIVATGVCIDRWQALQSLSLQVGRGFSQITDSDAAAVAASVKKRLREAGFSKKDFAAFASIHNSNGKTKMDFLPYEQNRANYGEILYYFETQPLIRRATKGGFESYQTVLSISIRNVGNSSAQNLKLFLVTDSKIVNCQEYLNGKPLNLILSSQGSLTFKTFEPDTNLDVVVEMRPTFVEEFDPKKNFAILAWDNSQIADVPCVFLTRAS